MSNKDCFDGCNIIKCEYYGQDTCFPPNICYKDPVIDRFESRGGVPKPCNNCTSLPSNNYNDFKCMRCTHNEKREEYYNKKRQKKRK